jgi:L-fuconolactonase
VAFESFGAKRLMFGSDWPVCLVAGSYERVVDVVREYLVRVSEGEREAVMGGTASEFWKLEKSGK